jgi:hypothetical protein
VKVTSKAQKEASARYQRSGTMVKSIKFIKNTDKDIIDYLEGLQKPFGNYVKNLIRTDMEAQKKSQG